MLISSNFVYQIRWSIFALGPQMYQAAPVQRRTMQSCNISDKESKLSQLNNPKIHREFQALGRDFCLVVIINHLRLVMYLLYIYIYIYIWQF